MMKIPLYDPRLNDEKKQRKSTERPRCHLSVKENHTKRGLFSLLTPAKNTCFLVVFFTYRLYICFDLSVHSRSHASPRLSASTPPPLYSRSTYLTPQPRTSRHACSFAPKPRAHRKPAPTSRGKNPDLIKWENKREKGERRVGGDIVKKV